MLETLLEDSWGTHMRRSVVSSVIYILLIIMFLILPVQMMQYSQFSALRNLVPFRPPCAYFWVNGQVLLEVTAVYLVVYYAIEPFRAALRESMDLYLPKVCRVLGLEKYLLPIKSDVLIALENGQDVNLVPETDSDGIPYVKMAGPRKLYPRKTPSYVFMRIMALVFLIWFVVLIINIILLSLLGFGIYLPFYAFGIEGSNMHGPYGLVATVLLGWMAKHRVHVFIRIFHSAKTIPTRILLFVMQPLFLTSMLTHFTNGNMTNNTYDIRSRSTVFNIVSSNYYLLIALVVLMISLPIVYQQNLRIVPSWYFAYMVLPFCICVCANLIVRESTTTRNDIEIATITTQTSGILYATNDGMHSSKGMQDILYILAKDYLGGIWGTAFLICLYDILSLQVLPTVSSFHNMLRDEKYLIGRKLQTYEKAQPAN